MDIERLRHKLIASARSSPVDDRVPYAFEKRVMAGLKDVRGKLDASTLWARSLWRAAAPCGAIALALAGWVLIDAETGSPPDISQEFESTVLAEVMADTLPDSSTSTAQ